MENQEKKEKLEEKVEKKESKIEESKKDNKEVKKQEKAPVKEKANDAKSTDEPKFKKASTETIKAETKKEKEASKKDNKAEKNNKTNKDKKQKGKSKVGYWVGGVVLLVIALALIMAFIVLPSSPEKTVEGLFNSLKTGDFQAVNKYVTNLEELDGINETDGNEIEKEGMQLLFNKLEWKIVNLSKEDNVAKVEVEITNKDFKTIMTNFMKKVVKVAMSGEAINEEKQEQYLLEELKNDSIQTVTEKRGLELEKQDGKWKVKVNEDVIMSLLPGLEDAMNSLETMFE